MLSFVARRLGQALLVVWGAVTIVFVIVRVIPGDPAQLILGSTATAQELDALRESLGLNRPFPLQYGSYLNDLWHLRFGESWRFGASALHVCLQRLPSTGVLAGSAFVVTLVVGIPLGMYAARHVDSIVDRALSVICMVCQGVPPFWVGLMASLLFARVLQVLPSTSDGSFRGLILPAITLALPFVGWVSLLVRSGTLEEMGRAYVRTARAKGLPSTVIFGRHVIRNILLPIVTVLGLIAGQFIADAVIVEVVFSRAGIGSLLIDSITNRDYSIVEAAVTLITIAYIVLSFIVDLAYVWLNPRIEWSAL